MEFKKRNRFVYILITILVVFLGLGSRKYGYMLPKFLSEYAGDTLWALMVFFLVGIIFNSLSTIKTAAIALTFSYIIEISQLYHAPWIEHIRNNKLGGLILGYGFLGSDLVCYMIGIMIGIGIEILIKHKTPF